MSLSRRDFATLIGAGVPATALIRPRRIALGTPADPIRLDSNENPYGPFPTARAAMTAAIADGGRYPSAGDLVTAVARANGVAAPNVLMTVGATEGLAIVARSFTGPTAPLITAAPTYAAIATATEAVGHPVIRIPILPDGTQDLDAMAERAAGAGVVYVCNPNNPTGSLITAPRLRQFLARVATVAPEATVVIGEAYHEYIDSPQYASAAAVALASPRVLVNRTFSKLFGLAGLRIGYLIGQEATLQKVAAQRVSLGANAMAIAAVAAALADTKEIQRQRELNSAGRTDAGKFFAGRGLRFYPAEANYLFVDIGRDVTEFRATCQVKGLLIGRLYPPATTWARFTIGTPDEMERAFAILRTVL